MKVPIILLLSCLLSSATPLFAQLTVTGNNQFLTLGENARLDASAVLVINNGAIQMTGTNTRLDIVNLSIGLDGQLLVTGNDGDVQVENGLGISGNGLLDITGNNAFVAGDLVLVQNSGTLRMHGSNGQLYSFDNFIIQDGGELSTRSYVEATEVNWNGKVVFLIAGDDASGDYGNMYSENSPINVNGSVEGQLFNGYEPATEQTYRLIDLDLNFNQSGFAEVTPGPGWTYDIEQNYADLIFDPNILPVEWLNFTGRWQETNVQLNWQTATESGSDYFGVERQSVRGDWEQIGTVPAAGNSSAVQSYGFLDRNPGPADPLLYRLRQVDLDGTINYSTIVALGRHGVVEPPKLFPNPVSNFFYVSGLTAGNYVITDATGRKVSSGRLAINGTQRIDLPANLPVGTYSLMTENGESIAFELVR